MAPGSILMGVALMLVVALYVGRPFLKGQRERREALSTREALQAHKEALVEQIRALDFELETGKMPEAEYQRQRGPLLQEAAAVMKELDALDARQPGNGAAGRAVRDVEADIEAAISSRRASRSESASAAGPAGEKATSHDSEAEIEAAIQQLRRTASSNGLAEKARPQTGRPKDDRAEPGGRFCSQCGKPREAGDKFCAYCGNRFA